MNWPPGGWWSRKDSLECRKNCSLRIRELSDDAEEEESISLMTLVRVLRVSLDENYNGSGSIADKKENLREEKLRWRLPSWLFGTFIKMVLIGLQVLLAHAQYNLSTLNLLKFFIMSEADAAVSALLVESFVIMPQWSFRFMFIRRFHIIPANT